MSKGKKPPAVEKRNAKIIPLVGSPEWHQREQRLRKERRELRAMQKEQKKKYEAQKPKKLFNVDEGPPAERSEKPAISPYWKFLHSWFGPRLKPGRLHYYLDGHPINHDPLMFTMNGERKAQGLEQVGIDRNPAWKA